MIPTPKKPLGLRPAGGPTPTELADLATGARFANLLPEITADTVKMKEAVERRIFAAMRDNTYTPAMADAAWREVYAIQMLLKKFQTRVSLGIDAADKHRAVLTIGEE